MTPADVVNAAREAIGTPFRHQGRTVGVGLDCAGLLLFVAGRLGIAAVDVTGYPRRPDGRLAAALDVQPALVRVYGPAQAGDLLLMRFEDDTHDGHLGICVGATLIHAWSHARKVCEHGFTPEWSRRVTRIYRFSEVSHGE